MRFISNITQCLFRYFNTLASRMSILVVLTSVLLVVQLAAPPPSSAECGDPCTPGSCCEEECFLECCMWDPYEFQCMQSCFICRPFCTTCCV